MPFSMGIVKSAPSDDNVARCTPVHKSRQEHAGSLEMMRRPGR
jgi:hypothetical protein